LGAVEALVMERDDEGFAELQGTEMAEPATEDARPNDFEAHVRDYSGFLRMFKWLAIVSFLTALFVMFIIS
jgi:hypothetical protein